MKAKRKTFVPVVEETNHPEYMSAGELCEALMDEGEQHNAVRVHECDRLNLHIMSVYKTPDGFINIDVGDSEDEVDA